MSEQATPESGARELETKKKGAFSQAFEDLPKISEGTLEPLGEKPTPKITKQAPSDRNLMLEPIPGWSAPALNLPPDRFVTPSDWQNEVNATMDAMMPLVEGEGITYDEKGFPLQLDGSAWDFMTDKTDPYGKELPDGAIGWKPEGKPDFGDGLMGVLRGMAHNFRAPSERDPDRPEPTPPREIFAEADALLAQSYETENFVEAAKLTSDAMKMTVTAGLGWGLASFVDGWTRLEDKETLVGGIARATGTAVKGLIEAYQIPTDYRADLMGPSLIAANEVISRAYERGGGTEERQAMIEHFRNYPDRGHDAWIQGEMKLLIKEGYATEAEYHDLETRFEEAGKMAYTAMRDPLVREEYVRLIEEGKDPRLVAMMLADPGAEAVGRTVNDPTIFFEIVGGQIWQAYRASRAARVYSKAADPDFVRTLRAVADATDDAAGASAVQESFESAQRMHQSARQGLVETGKGRAVWNFTAGGKRVAIGENINNFMMIVTQHVKKNPEELAKVMEGLVKMADPDNIDNFMDGMRILNQSGISEDVLFSQAGNETAHVMRQLLVDDAGEFSAKKIFRSLEEAGDDASELAAAFGREYDDALARNFPNVQEQIKQGEEYAELLAKDADEAARYLNLNPLADQEVGRLQRALAPIHEATQRFIYRPAASVQGVLYMGTNPVYRIRNRWSNSLQIFVDEGPVSAARSLINYSPTKSYNEIAHYLGDVVPEAAGRGIGFAGGGPTKIGDGVLHYFSKGAASDEASAAAVIVAKSVRESMLDALQEGRAIDTAALTKLSPEQRVTLVHSIRQHGGDVDAALDALRVATKEGGYNTSRNLSFVSDELENTLRDLNLYDGALKGVREADTAEDALSALDDLARAYQDEGARVARESFMPDLSTEEGRVLAEASHGIEDNLGSEAADLFEREAAAGMHATKTRHDAANELETLARKEVTIQSQVELKNINDPEYLRNGADYAGSVVDEIAGQFDGAVDDLTDETFAASRRYRDTTWKRSDLSKKRGRNLQKLWREVGIQGNPPADLSGRDFRDALWKQYDYEQTHRFRGLRRESVARHQQKAEAMAAAAGISPNTQKMRVAEVANSNARMFEGARLAADGTASARIPAMRLEDEVANSFARISAETAEVSGEEAQNFRDLIQRIRDSGADGQDAYRLGYLDQASMDAIESVAGSDPAKQAEVLDTILGNEYRVVVSEHTDNLFIEGPGIKEFTFKYRDGNTPPIHVNIDTRVSAEVVGEEALRAGLGVGPREGAGREAMQTFISDLDSRGEALFWTTDQTAEGTGFFSKLEEEGLFTRVGDAPRKEGEVLLEGMRPGGIYEINQSAMADEAFDINLVAPTDTGTPSVARMRYETNPVAQQAIDELKGGVSASWGNMEDVAFDGAAERELSAFAAETRMRVTDARAVSVGVAGAKRDFILHNYGKRRNIDTLLSYIYPYQFWHSRTYTKWMGRTLKNPYVVANYGRYRKYLEQTHAGMPDWWKYNINVSELAGIETDNPMWFNLEGSLNPLNGITGIDFNDPKKRLDLASSTIDDLNKLGPSTWTPYSLALALKYQMDGEEDAASRWAGRAWWGTRAVRDLTALMGVDEGKGIETDPFINYFSGGVGPYERGRVGRQLSAMVDEGKYTRAQIIDAGDRQEGPIWDEALAKAINLRAPNVAAIAAPFILGTGFKPRTNEDIEIDRFYGQMYGLYNMKPNLSPDEYSRAWAELRQNYPFMDVLLLAKSSGYERDEALVWSVLNRIPPGQLGTIAEMVGEDKETFDSFYDNKGEMVDMSEAEYMRVMAAAIEMGALLEVPDFATRGEWDASRAVYHQIETHGESIFGDDIWERADAFFAVFDPENPEPSDAILEADPRIGEALDWKQQMVQNTPLVAAYYTTAEKIEKFYKRQMYDDAEEKFGEELWGHITVQGQLYDLDRAAGNKYRRDNPMLSEYTDFREARMETIASYVEHFAGLLPEQLPVQFREGMEPTQPPIGMTEEEVWINEQVMKYAPEKAVEAALEEQEPAPTFQNLPTTLQRLLVDYSRGEELPDVAKRMLDNLGYTEADLAPLLPEQEIFGEEGGAQ